MWKSQRNFFIISIVPPTGEQQELDVRLKAFLGNYMEQPGTSDHRGRWKTKGKPAMENRKQGKRSIKMTDGKEPPSVDMCLA